MNKLALIWSLIEANVSNQLPKCRKLPAKHTGMAFLRKEVPYRSISSHFEPW